jgi:hypothetical protein
MAEPKRKGGAKSLLARMERTSTSDTPIAVPHPDVEEPIAAPVPEPAAPAAAVTATPPREKRQRVEKPSGELQAPKLRRSDALPRRLPSPANPSRFSLDLDRETHKKLRQFATLEAEVDQSAIGRVLVDLLLEDPGLRIRVRGRIDEQKQALMAEG